ncbi:MAG TPA: YdcF family protein [Clostridiaceae bacterium]|nr:YdcF family protein [Clostridiaceae bacterium]
MLKKILIIILVLILLIFLPNLYILVTTSGQITTLEHISTQDSQDYECALIFGAGVRDGKPSPILQERLNMGVALYQAGIVPKLLLSGQGSADGQGYDEVIVMREYLLAKNVPDTALILDKSGFSTYESIERCLKTYNLQKVLLVTQKYHLYRAVYLANQLELETIGVIADQRRLPGQFMREIREVFARDKDFIKGIIKP